MGTYASFYTASPTQGGTDGTALSENEVQTAPLSVTLDATKAESSIVKCAIRAATGYKTSGSTVIGFSGTDSAKWGIAADTSTAGSNTYTIGTNTVSGDTVTIGGVTLTAGTGFTVGTDTAATAVNIETALNANSTFSALYTASVSGSVITVTENYAGAGNTPASATTTGTIAITSGTAVTSAAATSTTMASATFASSLTITDAVKAANKVFWVKALSTSDEAPENDVTVSMTASATIVAA